MSRSAVPSAEELLTQAAWARRLANHLVRNRADAEDLAQSAWLASIEKGRPPGVALRAWMTGVMTNLARFSSRTALRRQRRETVVVEETLDAAEIARKLGISASTVRGRLRDGLEELRAALDRRHQGDRSAWLASLAPIAGGEPKATPSAAALPRRAAGRRLGLALAGCLLAAGVTLWNTLPARRGESATSEAASEETATQPPRALEPEAPVIEVPAIPPTASRRVAATEPTAPRVDRQFVPLGGGPVRGPATAKVTILEFVDYSNRACAQLEGTLERVMWIYRDDVRLQIIHPTTEADAEGVLAARLALAAEAQHKFWDAHYALVTRMQRLNEAEVADFADGLGLDLAQLESDRGSLAVTTQLELDAATAESLRVTESPTLFINGRKVTGAQPFASLRPIIDEEIATADALLQRGVAPEQLYNEILERGSSPAPNAKKEDKR